jgi:hypothetical protein
MDNESKTKWQGTRKLGYLRFVLKYGIGYWGVSMFVIMTFFVSRPFQEGFSFIALTGSVLSWSIGGAFFGSAFWLFNERKFLSSVHRDPET